MSVIVDPVVIAYLRDHPFLKRQAVSSNVLHQYPDKVPIIIGRGELKRTPPIDKCKFLAPKDISFSKFTIELRKYIQNINPTDALFFFLKNNTLPVPSMNMDAIYEKYKSNDGFLYINYSTENTFG